MGLFKDDKGKFHVFKPLNWGSDEFNEGRRDGGGWDLAKGFGKYVIGFLGFLALSLIYLAVFVLLGGGSIYLIWEGIKRLFGFNPFYVNPEYARLRWQGNPYFDFPVIRPEGF